MSHRILVPFELPDADPVPAVLVEDLAPMDVVVLGHYGLPEQTPMDAARAQFEDEAQAELDELARPFREAGSTVTTRLVFGKDRAKTVDRITLEEDCDAELDPAPTEGIERILVPLVDARNLDRLEDFVAALCEEQTTEITLFHVAERGFADEESEDPGAVEEMLRSARDRLIEDGFDPDLVDVAVVEDEGHDEAILAKAKAYDAVVMGEADPNVRERIFGTLPDRIARRTGDPVIVVRRNV
jgi:nucleotide-binding universal stress UspA family protein